MTAPARPVGTRPTSPTAGPQPAAVEAAVEAAERVRGLLRGIGRLGVAYSGGVDSSVLVALAVRELGSRRVIALLGVSASLPAAERLWAHEVADALGARIVEVATHEGERAAYVANGPDRCYHCKAELFTVIDEQVRRQWGLTAVAYGENADDLRRPDRPGARAAREHGVLTPLADAGLTKADVRAVARLLGVPSAAKPAAPCLASRIPHHVPVSPARLAQVERAEAAVQALGFAECRVRHHGRTARVELTVADLVRAQQPAVRARLVAGVTAAGFEEVVLDPAGLQSGAFTRHAMGLDDA